VAANLWNHFDAECVLENSQDLTKFFQAAHPALMINPSLAASELAVGASKFGGLPDLPPRQQ